MSITRYTTDQEFQFNGQKDSRAVVVNGSITVSVYDGDAWVETDTLTTGSYEYYTRNLYLQFVVNSGSFSIDED